jgi:ribosome-associated protein
MGARTVQINQYLEIPLAELAFAFSRSAGPGGQNVNKVSTKVQLKFDVATSPSLSEHQKAQINERLATRIDKAGCLRISSSSERSQLANKEAAVLLFARLLSSALRVRKKRIKSRPTAASKQRRLDAKRRQGERKQARGREYGQDD